MKFTAFVAFVRRVCSVYGHWGWTLVKFTAFVLFMGCWGWTFVALQHFVAFMGRWRCTFSTWVLFSLRMFLYAQHRWVPPGLAYWGSGFSKP